MSGIEPYRRTSLPPAREVIGAILLLVGVVGLILAMFMVDVRAGLATLSIAGIALGAYLGQGSSPGQVR